VFTTALDAQTNVDVITDFDVALDTIALGTKIFKAFGGMDISAGQLVIGTQALDADDFLIYDDTTGALFYDSDGVGGVDAIQFAQLHPGLALTHFNFELQFPV
jgi:Ca2+-binding RTX toxin-like protein